MVAKTFEDFSQLGLSEARQRLRFEHYQEKRQLKIKAVENLLIRTSVHNKDPMNLESLRMQALLEDMKRTPQQLGMLNTM